MTMQEGRGTFSFSIDLQKAILQCNLSAGFFFASKLKLQYLSFKENNEKKFNNFKDNLNRLQRKKSV